ncbi:AMP-binding protein [Pseudotabrizicola algicola]|uniref:4-coumarate--CoA ligase family protein n=1 Tax=Pseudotabrizicola algicola TaxID=2709381 RepID=A0A6B3RP97_9RHOB|nr:AMP-binding protein [Pseudotabrizicola algicola]NEX45895.1 4-coumarate--CoA ligase family protein [Pseudotabrizicola algicola]
MTLITSPLADVPVRDISITDCLFEGLADAPDRVVLIDGPSGRSLTGAALMAQVRSLAGGLTERGFGAGQVVALMAPNMPEYAVVFHAVAYAGGTITTLNPTYTAPEIRHQLTDAGASLLVTIADFLPQALAGAEGTGVRQVVVIGGAEGHAALDDLMSAPLTAQVPVDLERHIVVLPYSSGTTGLPKGVMLSHRNLVVNVDQARAVIRVVPAEVTVAFLPFFHIYGMNVLMNMHLVAGAALVTMPRFDLAGFLGHVQRHKVRMVMAVPPVVLAMAKHPMVADYDVSSLEILVSAAAPLGAELSDACAGRLNARTIQGYGMTELSPISHFSNEEHAKPGAVGITVPNTQCKVVDPQTGKALPIGEEGELCIRGPQVMQGYLNNPEATARTIDAEGWLHTGDIAAFDADGQLFIRDRLKELIKVKGFQVAPAEVEAVLQTCPGVLDAAVIGEADEAAGEVPVAFVVSQDGVKDEARAQQIIAFLRGHLATYKVPSRVEFIEAVPKSASGKILRRMLRKT